MITSVSAALAAALTMFAPLHTLAPAGQASSAIVPERVVEGDVVQGTTEDGAARAAQRACDWLLGCQRVDGRWTADWSRPDSPGEEGSSGSDDAFWDRALTAGGGAREGAAGGLLHDVGVTGLGMLAILDSWDSQATGSGVTAGHEAAAGRAIDWLLTQQEPESGLLGSPIGHAFHYDHAIGSLALVRGLGIPAIAAERPHLRAAAQSAISYIGRARNPYQAWRYAMPPIGDNDTSVTTWMTLAVVAAQRAGLETDPETRGCVLAFIDSMTSEQRGAVGYTEAGSLSARIPGVNEQFAPEKAATMTAAGLLCRLEFGQDPIATPAIVAHVKHILTKLPEETATTIDDSLWIYFGTRAMRTLGSRPWEAWSAAMVPKIIGAQVRGGPSSANGADAETVAQADLIGSFAPTGAWGFSVGRTGTTALMAMSLWAASGIESAHAGAKSAVSAESGKSPSADDVVQTREDNTLIGLTQSGGWPSAKGPNLRPQTIVNGLMWLSAHQDADGKWDADGFSKHDATDEQCDGAGGANNDVGVTALALLALAGDGSTLQAGPRRRALTKGIQWLLSMQDDETGLIGSRVGPTYHYDHAIATLLLCEICVLDVESNLRDAAQLAVDYIVRARNPYRVWRYESPPDGSNDTAVTNWMIYALKSASDAGLEIDPSAFAAASEWLDDMTDSETGRVGYAEAGSRSSRVPGVNDGYALESSEALTAASLLSLFFVGQNPEKNDNMVQHAKLLLKTLPEWEVDETANDLYYWYHGTCAMYQMGGKYWQAWSRSALLAMRQSQRTDGAAEGSWDPNGVWGYAGGRVYSTALMVMSLQVAHRYGALIAR